MVYMDFATFLVIIIPHLLHHKVPYFLRYPNIIRFSHPYIL